MIEEDKSMIEVVVGSSLDVALSSFHFSFHFIVYFPVSIIVLQLVAHPPDHQTCIFPFIPTKTIPRSVPKTMRNHFHQ